jgi:protein-S-isoprenylcysteine O-methyltransferase Ste14
MDKDKKALFFLAAAVLSGLFIVVTGPLFEVRNLTFLMVEIFGGLLIVWALLAQKVNKKHTLHSLPPGYFFLNKGPYEIIRHPVYAGILLIMSSLIEYDFVELRVLAFVILIAALVMKMLREEYALEQKIHDYAEYKKNTKYIIPYLF